jgi:hypothetical protein
VLCGDAWSDWLTYGFMCLGFFGFGVGVYRACVGRNKNVTGAAPERRRFPSSK